MAIRIYWINTFESGSKLGIMARPRGGEWLEDEIRGLARQGVGMLVSLLEGHEMDELDLTEEQKICEDNGIMFINFPIPDRSIPGVSGGVDQLVSKIEQSLGRGESTVVHCRMGIGRSSIIAANVLQRLG